MLHFLRVSPQHTTLETEEILFRMWAPKLLKSCSAKQAENYITSVLQQQICGIPNKKQLFRTFIAIIKFHKIREFFLKRLIHIFYV